MITPGQTFAIYILLQSRMERNGDAKRSQEGKDAPELRRDLRVAMEVCVVEAQ